MSGEQASYIISEINVTIRNLERLKREVEAMRPADAAKAAPVAVAPPLSEVPDEPDFLRDAPDPFNLEPPPSARPEPARQSAAPAIEFPRDPLAKSMNDLVTPKQLGLIRALAREAGVEADEECVRVVRVRTEELSKKAASAFIDHLKALAEPAARTA